MIIFCCICDLILFVAFHWKPLIQFSPFLFPLFPDKKVHVGFLTLSGSFDWVPVKRIFVPKEWMKRVRAFTRIVVGELGRARNRGLLGLF